MQRVRWQDRSLATRTFAPAIALALTLVLSACGPGGMHASLQRDGATVDVTVTDETGLITQVSGGSPQVPSPLPSAPAAWNPNGELTQISVYWQSTACSRHPTLDLSGNALKLVIDVGQPASGCTDGALVPNIVTLRLNAVTDVTAIRLLMAGVR